ncbi:MAG: hypothetical protein SGI96_21195 [Bacteroidota bacterium]|nr:hypothetical protein [Bacteroidota bacterium]
MSQAIFFNPFVSSAPILVGAGNGTLTVNRLTHFTVTQTYTAVCTAIAPFVVFQVIGSLDGPVGVAQVGQEFSDEDLKIFFTINQGPTLFDIGDTFTLSVTQGTDVEQLNIDLYDELPQKNFGDGVIGDFKGDHNVRFENLNNEAERTIQDLTFTSLLDNEEGNGILIRYANAPGNVNATLILQDLTYEAVATGTPGNAITVEYEDYDPAVNATVTIQDLLYAASNAGADGNNISIEYTTGATAGLEVVVVTVDAISIQIEAGVSTADQIKTAIQTTPAAIALVTPFTAGTGLETQTAPEGPTFLSGGLDAVGDAGNEVVTVVLDAIKVKLQTGVSAATQVKAALDASVPASAIVTATISGVGPNAQTAPVVPTNLAGGVTGSGGPGFEIVTVNGTYILVEFQSLASNATQIKTAIAANVDAAAIVAIDISGTASDPQSAPAIRFLRSGSPVDYFSFNKRELSVPLEFYEGNANLLGNKGIFQSDIWGFGNTTLRGIVKLDDIRSVDNISGDPIYNLQKETNILIQFKSQLQITLDEINPKRVKLSGADIELLDGRILRQEISKKIMKFEGAVIDLETGDVFESDGITPYPDSFLPSAIPIANYGWYSIGLIPDIADSENRMTVKVRVEPAIGFNVTSESAPRANFVGSKPIGEVFVQSDGVTIENLLEENISQMGFGAGGGGGVGYQEIPTGLVNGLNDTFALTKVPSDNNSVLLFIDFVAVDRAAYNLLNQVITITDPTWVPQIGQQMYAFYLIDGSGGGGGPAPTGTEYVEYRTLTAPEATAKQLVLAATPASILKVKVDIIGGTSQEFGIDFTVIGNVLGWNGLGMDLQGIALTGDKLRVTYFN